jgi:hypothetical protein
MGVAEDAAADAQDHWSVTLEQGREGGFLAFFDEVAEQVGIAPRLFGNPA